MTLTALPPLVGREAALVDSLRGLIATATEHGLVLVIPPMEQALAQVNT